MKNPRWLLLLLLVPLLSLAACGGSDVVCEDGKYSKACPPPKSFYDNRIDEAKRYLSMFDGKRARDVFKQVNEDHIRFNSRPYCTAAYGVVLADVQVVIENLNGLILRFLTNAAVSGAPRAYEPAAPQAHDFGVMLENGWSSFEPVLVEMSEYARTVTAIPDCSFSIGLDEKLKSTQLENPYQYVINIGGPGGTFSPADYADEAKLKNAPVVQLVFKTRFDGAEARLLDMLASTMLGGAHFALAHDFSLKLDVVKIAMQIGLPVDCVRENILDCSFDEGVSIDAIINNILGWSFLFQDNPNFLAQSGTRWDRRMSRVDNEFAGAFKAMRTFFSALVARNERLRVTTVSSQQLEEYTFFYRDNNENSVMDAFDDMGITITSIRLSPEFIIHHTNMEATPEGKKRANELRSTFRSITSIINGFSNTLQGLLDPTEGAIREIQTFIDRGYANFAAVDNPNVPHERIPINSFNTVFQDFFFPLIDAPMPNFMEFDVTAYFTEPKPLRSFIPYWQIGPNFQTGSEFLIDSDRYRSRNIETNVVTGVTAPQWIRILEWDTEFHVAANSPDTPAKLWPDASGERSLFSGSFNGGLNGTLTGISVPSDCINAANLYSTLSVSSINSKQGWPVFYLALPDATLNGMIWSNLDEWAIYYDNASNGAACAADPQGLQPASNYSVTKGLWMMVDFFIDNTSIFSLLGGL